VGLRPGAGDHALERGDRVWLRKLRPDDQDALLAMVATSRSLHHPWTRPPDDEQAFRALIEHARSEDFVSLVGWRAADGALAAVVNLSQIVRGAFNSCYCGFYANAATAGQSLTRETLELVLRYAFTTEHLHRVEANVQPANAASIALVRRLGFRHEGFSPRYLHIDEAWRDHERFAMTLEDWLALDIRRASSG
jgi:ribosomal-protein-alanine N-acetyltransferase